MWELVEVTPNEITKRLKVHNGWLVLNRYADGEKTWCAMHYFKDPDFEWKIEMGESK